MTDFPAAHASRHRQDARAIFAAAVAAADPASLVRGALSVRDGALQACGHRFDLARESRLVVVGAGKATPAMAAAAEEVLGDRIDAGAINTKYGHARPLQRIETVEGGHPLPDAAGVAGSRRILQLVGDLGPNDLALCLFSGGGSALMPAPAAGITLRQKSETTALLLACGATIDELNAIRKHLSAVKGGLLARRAAPARVVCLLVSDVIGDPLHTIASGPTAPDPTTFADCLGLLDRYDLRARVPSVVAERLARGAAGALPETPKPGDPALAAVVNAVIGNNAIALAAARDEARRRGYTPLVLSSRIAGETRDVAAVHAAIAEEVAATGQPVAPPACIISGGETTVTLRGTGRGGRNQEFALAAALRLRGTAGVTAFSCGTDGTDGPTDAAGAVADGDTVARAAARGLSAAEALARNDAYPFFAGLGDLVVTGPTGTNVMDLRLLLVS